jgi:Trp operon repressor
VLHKYEIEERRLKVATLLAQSMNETEIALELRVDQSTISRGIKVLKELSNNYVLLFDSLSHTYGYTNQSELESIFNPYN